MSRKKQVNQKITALYCRISLEDGGDNESMSISNQKLMLRDFAEKNGMFQYEYYVDDGYTGRNFNRPSFQRMIADIEAGKIGCVITKDLSRLGRNYIEAGSYIEIFFPKHNVRYIAITDGVDSLTRQEMDITPFKNILNDMYSRDISKKVLAGRMTRSRQGKFCGGQPPLGLMRDQDFLPMLQQGFKGIVLEDSWRHDSYGPGTARAARLFSFDEQNAALYTTRLLTFAELVP